MISAIVASRLLGGGAMGAIGMARALAVPTAHSLAASGALWKSGGRLFAAQASPPSLAPSSPGPSSTPPPKDAKLVLPSVGQPAGAGQTFAAGAIVGHPGMRPAPAGAGEELEQEAFLGHPHYDWKYLESIHPVHVPPKDAADRVGMAAVRVLRSSFDWITNYPNSMTEAKWLTRVIFLETVAGVPGMVAGMLRHLHSLRLMRRDKGWIHQLLEEAENERMHLLTALEIRQPKLFLRLLVLATQGVFFNAYFLAYLVWPKACHSFVGYLEEEAVKTYTHALNEIDQGRSLAAWKSKPAPPIAQTYWGLPKDATLRDLVLAIRADEACHSHVNHTLKTLKPTDANPFALGKSQLP